MFTHLLLLCIKVSILPGKPGIFSFTFPGLENAGICSKTVKTCNFNTKPRKKLVLCKFCFQDSLFKMSFSKEILIYAFVNICIIKPNCIYLEITWKTHRILCHQRNGNPVCFNTFWDFYNYNLYESIGNLVQNNLEKNWNLGPKTLRKPGIWYFEKGGNPVCSMYAEIYTQIYIMLSIKICRCNIGIDLLLNLSGHSGCDQCIWVRIDVDQASNLYPCHCPSHQSDRPFRPASRTIILWHQVWYMTPYIHSGSLETLCIDNWLHRHATATILIKV